MFQKIRKGSLRALAFLLALAVTFTLFPAARAAGETKFTEDGLGYRITVDKNGAACVEITDYTGTVSELVIPSRIDGLPVTAVAGYAFDDCTVLTEVIIPDSVVQIGRYAFHDCTKLVRVVLPEGITELLFTFEGCTKLSDVVIPESVTCIGQNAFYGCKSLTDIRIPESVTHIDYCAFLDCSSLTTLRIPKNVEYISVDAFLRCSGMTEYLVDEENIYFSARDGVLYNKDQTTLIQAPGALSGCFMVPEGVTVIQHSAFRELSRLTGIVIADTVTEIEEWAFQDCTNLEHVTLPSGITRIAERTFSGCESLTQLQLPSTVKYIDDYAIHLCTSLKSIEIPTSVKRISYAAFFGCDAMETITFLGNAPLMKHNSFKRVNATCYYSTAYADWTEQVMLDYSGELTWVPSEEIHVHEYRTDVTPPGCLTWGYTTFSCDCGYSYTDHKTFFTGHSLGEWSLHTPASCIQYGEEVRSCSSCDYQESRSVDRTAHSFAGGFCQVCGCAEDTASQSVDVTQYSYTVTPILSPFAYYLYVQTDNPDPRSFRLVDRESAYYSPGDQGSIRIPSRNGYYSTETEPGTYYASQSVYPDVVYEDQNIRRVPGGYIFLAHDAYSDGGEFHLLQLTRTGSNILGDCFRDTDVVIPCQKLYTMLPYLIDHCTDPEQSLFENLDQVSYFLYRYAVYPRSVYDQNKPRADRPYPMIVSSIYPEYSLDRRYTAMFEKVDGGLLMMAAYPFVLDSLSYPGTIGAVAKLLEPSCTADSTTLHYQVKVTHNGVSHIYSGAGQGSGDHLYIHRVEKVFSFSGSGDCASAGTIDSYRKKLLDYEAVIAEDTAEYYDFVQGEIFLDTIRRSGSTWAQVAAESFFGYGTTFGYLWWDGSSVWGLENTWVDGRYVNDHEAIQLGAKYEDYPLADILLHDVTYTNYYGVTVTGDAYYQYSEAWGHWRAGKAYAGDIYDASMELPEELILTHEEVAALDLDANSHKWPESGLIYDGTLPPATPFAYTSVTGVSLTESVTLRVGDEAELELQVYPADADDPRVEYTIGDNSIVQVVDSGKFRIRALAEGTTQITVKTIDGGYTAVCQVTVKKSADQLHSFTDVPEGAFYYEPVLWAVENGITNGTSATTFGPNDQCMRAHVVTFLWRAAGAPEPKSTHNPFVDVKPSDFYYKSVLWALENGITAGMDATHFGPTIYCNRAQVVTFLHRTVGSPDPESPANPFTDVASGAFYEKAVLWAVEEGITNGLSANAFGPGTICNRAQIVTFLYRAFSE